MTYRKGDRISIQGIVKHNQDDDKRIFIDVVGSYETLWMEPGHLTLVTPLFEVGDKCSWDHDSENLGIVLAVNDGYAWINITDGTISAGHCTRLLTSIERVDDESAV